MSRVTRRQATKSQWRRGLVKQYGVQAVQNFATKSNAQKK